MIRNLDDLVAVVWLFVVFAVLTACLTGCGVSARIDWHGESGLSDTVVSKEFVETKKPITDRRY